MEKLCWFVLLGMLLIGSLSCSSSDTQPSCPNCGAFDASNESLDSSNNKESAAETSSGTQEGGDGAGGSAGLSCDKRFAFIPASVQAGVSFVVQFYDTPSYEWVALDLVGPGSPKAGDVKVLAGSPNYWLWEVTGHEQGVLSLSFVRDRTGGKSGTVVATCQLNVGSSDAGAAGSDGGAAEGPYLHDPAGPEPCAAVEGQSYGVTTVTGHGFSGPADAYNGTNFLLYKREQAAATEVKFVSSSGPPDPYNSQPTFRTLFTDNRKPVLESVFWIQEADGTAVNPPSTGWPGVLVGFAATQGEILRIPDTGPAYNIAPDGSRAMVLYASDKTITLRYGNIDDVSASHPGYTVHVDGVCVEPSLRALYEQHATSRAELPRLRSGEPFGRTWGKRMLVALRDSGTFMDTRDDGGGSGGWYRLP